MGAIADRVREMRGCSLATIVAEIERMEAGGAPDLFGEVAPIDDGGLSFATWWEAWGDKVSRKEAKVAYDAARKKGWAAADLLTFAAAYMQAKPADRPWMHASTFLRGERWKDRPAQLQPLNAVGSRRQALRERVQNDHGIGSGREGSGDPRYAGFLPSPDDRR